MMHVASGTGHVYEFHASVKVLTFICVAGASILKGGRLTA